MRDDSDFSVHAHEGLNLQALLYASGELAEAEAQAFEDRLETDQSTRDALCQAVQLTWALDGRTPRQPDPAYRERVRQRLQRPSAARSRWRYPLFWGGLGAAAAALLLSWYPFTEPLPVEQPVVVSPTPPPETAPVAVADTIWDEDDYDPDMALEMANVWAELHQYDHLERAREDELRRRLRAEERSRLIRPDDRRSRLLGPPPRYQPKSTSRDKRD
ncbi:MAG: hypothetical protein ACK4RK_04680 [Gemmataceae bacterium]